MLAILAQIGGGYSLVHVLILIVVIAAAVAIVYAALRQFGIAIPSWVIQIFWIVIVAIVAILAINFVMSMA